MSSEPRGRVELRLDELNIGPVVGEGGGGQVRLLGEPLMHYVYKRYVRGGQDESALRDLIALPAAMNEMQRRWFLERTAWPESIVSDSGVVTGYLMRAVPGDFYGPTMSGPHLREVSYLIFPPVPFWSDIEPLDAAERIEFLRQTAMLFSLLHAHGLIVGDVSMKNLLWSRSPAAVMLLDCDSIHRQGHRGVLPPAETPDWHDPLCPPGQSDQDSDCYKLALVVARVLAQSAYLVPGQPFDALPGVPRKALSTVGSLFRDAGGPRGSRPKADQWVRALAGSVDLPVVKPTLPPRLSRLDSNLTQPGL